MESIKIKEDIYWVGVKNPDLRVFDIIMETQHGTTYNSYLIVDEKITLIDTVKDGFYGEFISKIKEIIGDKKIDYIVVNHTEPDHSGSLDSILREYKDAVVYASRGALMNIKEIINRDFNGIEAKGELNIGKRTLKFISAPLLHWPDTIFTYDEYDEILFTCDAFGCHYCADGIFNCNSGNFSKEFAYYYNVIMGPFKKNVLLAIDKIKDLKINILAPSHGPIHVENPMIYVKLYEDWSRQALCCDDGKYAVVFYVSAYGYTGKIARAIAEGIKEAGAKVDLINAENVDPSKIAQKIEMAKAIAVGSPTINQDAVKPIWDVLSLVCPITNMGKIAVTFGSYGWSGEAPGLISERLKGLKFRIMDNSLKIKFNPTDDDLEKAKDIGKQIATKLGV